MVYRDNLAVNTDKVHCALGVGWWGVVYLQVRSSSPYFLIYVTTEQGQWFTTLRIYSTISISYLPVFSLCQIRTTYARSKFIYATYTDATYVHVTSSYKKIEWTIGQCWECWMPNGHWLFQYCLTKCFLISRLSQHPKKNRIRSTTSNCNRICPHFDDKKKYISTWRTHECDPER